MIESLAKQSQPRERLIEFGAESLSDYELIAILLRTGTKNENVLQLAMKVAHSFEHISQLKEMTLDGMQLINGIGPTKAIMLQAAIELGYRIATRSPKKYEKLSSTEVAGEGLMSEMGRLHQEHLMVLFLNTKNQLLAKKTIFIGTVNSSMAHPREIFKMALRYPTARLIVAHNHPSGECEPSIADIQFTKRLIQCGEMIGIEVLDHFIVGDKYYISLREKTALFQV